MRVRMCVCACEEVRCNCDQKVAQSMEDKVVWVRASEVVSAVVCTCACGKGKVQSDNLPPNTFAAVVWAAN